MTTPRRKRADKTANADIAIDFVIDSGLWKKHPGAQDTIRQAIGEAARASRALPGDIAAVLTDDAAMQALNKRWRGHDKPTNVLSFPAHAIPGDGELAHFGDIVIAFETTAAEAERDGKLFAHHLAHLAVHGYLHLLGHDHESDRDADAMERLETDILARIGVPDPYAGGQASQDVVPEEAATLKSHA
jgi:probable rRNA maturation factor